MRKDSLKISAVSRKTVKCGLNRVM